LVHAFADDFDRLIERARGDFLAALSDESQQERRSALQIETEADFFLRRNDRFDAERQEQDGQNQTDGALASGRVGHEIPDEQAEDKKTEEEDEGRAHGAGAARAARIRRRPPWSPK